MYSHHNNMYGLKFVTLVLIIMFVSNTISTQDVNLSMFMYLVNHLTPQECVKLTAYLYAEGLEPTAAKELGIYIIMHLALG